MDELNAVISRFLAGSQAKAGTLLEAEVVTHVRSYCVRLGRAAHDDEARLRLAREQAPTATTLREALHALVATRAAALATKLASRLKERIDEDLGNAILCRIEAAYPGVLDAAAAPPGAQPAGAPVALLSPLALPPLPAGFSGAAPAAASLAAGWAPPLPPDDPPPAQADHQRQPRPGAPEPRPAMGRAGRDRSRSRDRDSLASALPTVAAAAWRGDGGASAGSGADAAWRAEEQPPPASFREPLRTLRRARASEPSTAQPQLLLGGGDGSAAPPVAAAPAAASAARAPEAASALLHAAVDHTGGSHHSETNLSTSRKFSLCVDFAAGRPCKHSCKFDHMDSRYVHWGALEPQPQVELVVKHAPGPGRVRVLVRVNTDHGYRLMDPVFFMSVRSPQLSASVARFMLINRAGINGQLAASGKTRLRVNEEGRLVGGEEEDAGVAGTGTASVDAAVARAHPLAHGAPLQQHARHGAGAGSDVAPRDGHSSPSRAGDHGSVDDGDDEGRAHGSISTDLRFICLGHMQSSRGCVAWAAGGCRHKLHPSPATAMRSQGVIVGFLVDAARMHAARKPGVAAAPHPSFPLSLIVRFPAGLDGLVHPCQAALASIVAGRTHALSDFFERNRHGINQSLFGAGIRQRLKAQLGGSNPFEFY